MPNKFLFQQGDQIIKLHFQWSSLRQEAVAQAARKKDGPAVHRVPFCSFDFLFCELMRVFKITNKELEAQRKKRHYGSRSTEPSCFPEKSWKSVERWCAGASASALSQTLVMAFHILANLRIIPPVCF